MLFVDNIGFAIALYFVIGVLSIAGVLILVRLFRWIRSDSKGKTNKSY